MSVKEEITKTIKVLKELRKFKSQKDVAEYLEYNPSYFSRAINERIVPPDLEERFFNVFPKSVYLYNKSNEDFLSHLPEPEPKINPTKEDALKNLYDITSKGNGKHKNKSK